MTLRRSSLRIVIPTLNSASYLRDVLAFYKANRIDVTVYVDTKSVDETRSIARQFFDVVDMENGGSIVEHVIEKVSQQTGADWVLRIDDDELPTLAMMRFIADALVDPASDEIDVFGFARHQCLVSIAGRLLAHVGHSAAVDHRQWRLYRPDRVRFTSCLHTAGFEIPGLRASKAPDEACMIHLDWVVHSYAERRAKLARYAAIQPERSERDTDYYLVEMAGVAVSDLRILDLPEFDDVVRRLSTSARLRRYAAWKWSLPQ